jgi:glutamyl-tRNA reductase
MSRSPARLAAARGAADDRPLLCVDLGVPRDMDPAVASIPGVTLIDVDDVDAEAGTRHLGRSREVEHAEAIVVEETERFLTWWQGRGVSATIGRLHARAAAIRDAELDRALARLPDLSPRERLVVSELATRVAAKLLHEPTVNLKRDAEGANMALVVERLFALALDEGIGDLEQDPALALHALNWERRGEGIAS